VVRAQRLPHAELCTRPARHYGRAILDTDLAQRPTDRLCVGSPVVIGAGRGNPRDGCVPAVRAATARGGAARPVRRLAHVADYLKWTLVAPPESLGLTDRTHGRRHRKPCTRRPGGDRGLDPVLASCPVRGSVVGVRAVDPGSAAGGPVAHHPDHPAGDAIHATTPAGGTGANVALRDAALPDRTAHRVDRGRADLLDAIVVRGADARVRLAASTRSLRSAEQIFEHGCPYSSEPDQGATWR